MARKKAIKTKPWYLRSDFWLHSVCLPLALGAAGCLLFADYIENQRQLPPGVNLAFTRTLAPWLLGLAALAGLAAFAARRQPAAKPVPAADPGWQDGLLLLMPLAPILKYAVANRAVLGPADMLLLLATFAVPIALLAYGLPFLLQLYVQAKVLRVLVLALAFMLTNMASLSASFLWYEHGDFQLQALILLAVFALVAGLYLTGRRGLLAVLAAVFFASSALTPPPSADKSVGVLTDLRLHPLFTKLAGRQPVSRPNVYLLIYDSYVPNEVMLQYGIDNQAQEEYLSSQGFTLYPHTYSIGGHSVASMSPTLNISTDFLGNNRRGTSGDGVVQQAFHDLGYNTYGYFADDFFFRSIGSSYDHSFPEVRPVSSTLIDGVLMGELRFDLGFDQLTLYELAQRKLDLFGHLPSEPVFLYSHTFVPGHSQNSGQCRENETELFAERLEAANVEMRADLDTLVANDPTAIIIVAGDHGPYLSKNCFSTGEGGYNLHEITRYDIQDRFGTFLAIHWPDEGHADYDQITVLQDIFPAVFAYLYQDAGILDVRVPPVIIYEPSLISGASVENGIIRGGVDDGEPLFLAPLDD